MKSPAFQFYSNDFLGGKIATYDLDEIGLYSVLLAFDWSLTGLPTDDEKLAKLARVSTRKFRALWLTVKENFVERDGRYFNPRLEIERAKQEENRAKRAAAANSRWHPEADALASAHAMQAECPPTPSPSSIAVVEHSIAVRGGTAEAETALRSAMGDQMPAVVGFLDGRPANARANWFPELLKIIGPATGVLPEDLAGACSDAALVDPPATTPVAIRAFAKQRMRERIRASIPVPEIVRAAALAPDAVAEDEARWSAALTVASKLRRNAMTSEAFNALPAPLRHALRSVGGWKVLDEAKPSSIPYLRRDFLASYRAAEANASTAGAA